MKLRGPGFAPHPGNLFLEKEKIRSFFKQTLSLSIFAKRYANSLFLKMRGWGHRVARWYICIPKAQTVGHLVYILMDTLV
jgi:hypothetical protein